MSSILELFDRLDFAQISGRCLTGLIAAGILSLHLLPGLAQYGNLSGVSGCCLEGLVWRPWSFG